MCVALELRHGIAQRSTYHNPVSYAHAYYVDTCYNVPYDRWFSPEARSVIDRILVPDPKQRLTLAQMKVYTYHRRITYHRRELLCSP